ncbi:hypothetical protein Noc_1880 [Nitrosococcus oceani ATCC 19707]|uniref:Uncharacterized protein n=2 Tax=Nitrosococcus oceani TaxID=1229 RepID=Q3JA00_NITOC|nr:hypothetical protein [Nitrosococcus oceani]ABA58346.1 hypothetical protein Noc_1880 [Nitrosococcus oceani ATCC 19707]EDZ67640.1 hypothetical protein NOC27_967 [Nitrosococcus oceani AFC27]KFI19275.1 hypothetical protein IB75_10015 [Nitrosococcus oceani C-27]GEM18735.1 hypothetical protein NONS58_00920 [Nitrosococcus oceani]
MPDHNEEELAAVANAIKHYFDAHPNAADSVEGIARWWLTRQRFKEATETIEKALECLVAEGEVTKMVTGEGKFVYSYAKGKMTRD